jgi:hypothetical protein
MGRRTSVRNKQAAGKAMFFVLALAIVVVGMFALAPAASAQTTITGEGECFFDPYGDKVCPSDEVREPESEVGADLLRRPSTPPDTPAAGDEDATTLPFTGADVTLFLVTGVALVATGSVLVRRTRTRRSEA